MAESRQTKLSFFNKRLTRIDSFEEKGEGDTEDLHSYKKAFKVIMLGSAKAGKTSLISRFASSKFELTSPSLGMDMESIPVKIDNQTVRLHIWDSAGNHKYAPVTNSYC